MILLRILKNDRLLGTGAMFLLLIALFIPSFIEFFRAGGYNELAPHSSMPFYNLLFGSIHKVPVLGPVVRNTLT